MNLLGEVPTYLLYYQWDTSNLYNINVTVWYSGVQGSKYMYIMRKHHIWFEITECVLVIDPLFPLLGATPDGLVTCAYCASGTWEIKCPFSCWKKGENSRIFESKRRWHFEIETNSPIFLPGVASYRWNCALLSIVIL